VASAVRPGALLAIIGAGAAVVLALWWHSTLVLWYRVVVPLRAVVRHGFRVAGIRQEAPRTVSIYVKGRRLRELQAEPGQFFRWRFLARGMWWQSHPYSLSAVPSDGLMRITAREVGDDSSMLRSLRPGVRVIAAGPFGAFTPGRTGRSVLLLADGVGIAPLRAMFAALTGKITLIYRASSWQDIVFRPELDAIAAAKNATVHYIKSLQSALDNGV
jgi:ferredoxin-NADP reductase